MINTTPITQFINTLKSAELSQQKEVKIPIQQARLLSLALAEILDKMNQDYESMFNELKKSASSDTVTVELDGGDFSNN
jgi:uncharacterized membrane-anchored protein YhcB (DUF1043 family)